MSIKVMTWVWDHGPADPTDRLVLLALADFANDVGDCWPSMASIGKKAGVTERGARNIVRRLEGDGWLSTQRNVGRGNANLYRVTMARPAEETPRSNWGDLRRQVFERDGMVCSYCGTTDGPFDVDHVVAKANGGRDELANLAVACRSCNNKKAARTDWKPERETGTRNRNTAANPESECRKPGTTVQKPGTVVPPNHQEPSREPSKVSYEGARDHLAPIIGEELADTFIGHRKALRAPLTDRAAKIMAGKLAQMPDPRASVEQSITRGWRDVFPVKAEILPLKPEKADGRPSRSDQRLDAFLRGAAG